MKQLSFIDHQSKDNDTVNIPQKKDETLSLWKLFIDGASRNNPGPSGAGIYLLKNGKEVVKKGYYLGIKTNNQAEYLALLIGIRYFKELSIKPADPVAIYSDSQLMINQLHGIYRVKNSALKEYFLAAQEQLKKYNYSLHHILRHKNTHADALANYGIDNKVELPSTFI